MMTPIKRCCDTERRGTRGWGADLGKAPQQAEKEFVGQEGARLGAIANQWCGHPHWRLKIGHIGLKQGCINLEGERGGSDEGWGADLSKTSQQAEKNLVGQGVGAPQEQGSAHLL